MKRINNLYREQLAVSPDMPSGRVYFSSAYAEREQMGIDGCDTEARKPATQPRKPVVLAGQISFEVTL